MGCLLSSEAADRPLVDNCPLERVYTETQFASLQLSPMGASCVLHRLYLQHLPQSSPIGLEEPSPPLLQSAPC